MQDIDSLINELKAYIEGHQFQQEPKNLYDPINYILEMGGKRIRPLLSLLGAQLYSDHLEDVFPIAYAVEMFHNFTLMHDDIMDDAPLRRGKATVHTKYDVATGILSGDAMLLHSFLLIQSIKDPVLSQKLHESFTKTAIEICEGQQMDMDFEKRKDVEIAEYIRMIELKTAVLLGLSLQMGASLKTQDETELNHIYEFGRNMGIAFQIQDDVLDVYGDNEKFGKQRGGDIIQNKKTYLFLKALELSEGEQKRSLNLLYSGQNNLKATEKVSAVKTIFDELVVVEYANQLMEAYTDLAFSHLDAIKVDDGRKMNLRSIAQYLLNRKY